MLEELASSLGWSTKREIKCLAGNVSILTKRMMVEPVTNASWITVVDKLTINGEKYPGHRKVLYDEQLYAFQSDAEVLRTELDRISESGDIPFDRDDTICALYAFLDANRDIIVLAEPRDLVNSFRAAWRNAMLSLDCAICRVSGNVFHGYTHGSQMYLEETDRFQAMLTIYGEDR